MLIPILLDNYYIICHCYFDGTYRHRTEPRMSRYKVENKRDVVRQVALTADEDQELSAVTEAMMLSRSSFIRWAVLSHLRSGAMPRIPIPQRIRGLRLRTMLEVPELPAE